MFKQSTEPKLTKNFAGIGTRDIEKYNVFDKTTNTFKQREQYVGDEISNATKQAIYNLFNNSIKQEKLEGHSQSGNDGSIRKDLIITHSSKL